MLAGNSFRLTELAICELLSKGRDYLMEHLNNILDHAEDAKVKYLTKFQFSISVPLYIEYQDVLTRKEHLTGASTEKEIPRWVWPKARYAKARTGAHL